MSTESPIQEEGYFCELGAGMENFEGSLKVNGKDLLFPGDWTNLREGRIHGRDVR